MVVICYQLSCKCVPAHLEEAAGILVTQVNVDHLQQSLDFFVAHLVIVVLISPTQVSMNPGDTQSRKQQNNLVIGHLDQNSLKSLQKVILPCVPSYNINVCGSLLFLQIRVTNTVRILVKFFLLGHVLHSLLQRSNPPGPVLSLLLALAAEIQAFPGPFEDHRQELALRDGASQLPQRL